MRRASVVEHAQFIPLAYMLSLSHGDLSDGRIIRLYYNHSLIQHCSAIVVRQKLPPGLHPFFKSQSEYR